MSICRMVRDGCCRCDRCLYPTLPKLHTAETDLIEYLFRLAGGNLDQIKIIDRNQSDLLIGVDHDKFKLQCSLPHKLWKEVTSYFYAQTNLYF